MLIDNDEAKRLFPEFNNGWGAGVVHEESQIHICICSVESKKLTYKIRFPILWENKDEILGGEILLNLMMTEVVRIAFFFHDR